MLQIHIRDDGALRRLDDVRRVQPASEAHFQHDDLALFESEDQQRHDGDALEDGGFVLHLLDLYRHQIRRVLHIFVGHVPAVDLHALVVADQMRRRIQARMITRRAQHGFQHGGGAALAVRAGDMDVFQLLMRVTEQMQQFLYARKPQTAAHPVRDL